jgi:SAM-dependent methyltransferase
MFPAWTAAMSVHDYDPRHAFDAPGLGELYQDAFSEHPEAIAEVDRFLSRLPRDALILDAGCGGGVPFMRHMLDRGFHVCGFDSAPAQVALARRQMPEAQILLGDLRDPPPCAQRFDAMTAFFSLLMLKRREIGPALRKLGECLQPDAPILLAMAAGDEDDKPIVFVGRPMRMTAIPADDYAPLLHEAGYRLEALRPVNFKSKDGWEEPQLFVAARKLPTEG